MYNASPIVYHFLHNPVLGIALAVFIVVKGEFQAIGFGEYRQLIPDL
jgi:hypothetical protein